MSHAPPPDDRSHAGPRPRSGRPDTEDELGRLIRLAETGPEIPRHGAEHLKARLRPLWQEEVRLRARRRRRLWATGLAAAASLAVAVVLARHVLLPGIAGLPTAARVAAVSGAVELADPRHRVASFVEVGDAVPAGARLRTDGGSRVALELAGGGSLRVDHGTEVSLTSGDRLELGRGGVYVDSQRRGLEISTRFGLARDIGTRFEVRQSDSALTVRVRDGLVEVAGTSPQPLEVRAHDAVVVGADGSVSRSAVEPFAPEWRWTEEIAPPFAIEGATVAELLEWVGHESGRKVRYANPDVGLRAANATLHGSIAGLRPLEALEATLPSSGLAATITDGTLTVELIGPS